MKDNVFSGRNVMEITSLNMEKSRIELFLLVEALMLFILFFKDDKFYFSIGKYK